MQTSRNTTNTRTRRQTWLTTLRIATFVMVTATLAFSAASYFKQPAPVSSTELNKVESASRFIQAVGFNNPEYLGIEFAQEAEFPTFRAEAIGGKPIKLLIRTTKNGGMEIQPDGLFRTIASAEQFALIASTAVADWERIPADIKPSMNGAFGEYESRKYAYDNFAKYSPSTEFWANARNELSGWPDK